MQKLRALLAWIFDVYQRQIANRVERARLRPIVGRIINFIDGTWMDFGRHEGQVYVGAVSFYSLISLIPIVVVLASAAGYALYAVGADGQVALDRTLREVVRYTRTFLPYLADNFEEDLRAVIEYRRRLGLFGLFVLLLSASQVFRALEYALARCFDIDDNKEKDDQPPHFVISKVLAGAFMLAVVVLLSVLRFLVDIVHKVIGIFPPQVQKFVGDILQMTVLSSSFINGAAVVVGFAAILKFFTPQKVKIGYALVGGMVFYILMKLAQYFYSFYLGYLTNLGAVYGSFATVLTLVLWVSYLCSLLLVCSYLVRYLQYRRVIDAPRLENARRLTLLYAQEKQNKNPQSPQSS